MMETKQDLQEAADAASSAPPKTLCDWELLSRNGAGTGRYCGKRAPYRANYVRRNAAFCGQHAKAIRKDGFAVWSAR